MRNIKAVYDGKRVKLLEPVDLPADTPLEGYALYQSRPDKAWSLDLQEAKALIEELQSR